MEIPGFVDLQVNGYQGVNFSSLSLTKEKFIDSCKKLIAQGTTVFLPTLVTSSVDIYKRNLPLIAQAIEHKDLKNHIPGIHIEGPFISKKDGARGAHQAKWIKEPDIQLFNQLLEWSHKKIKLLTIAAEVKNANRLCTYAAEQDIIVSLGHQMATEKDLTHLVNAGASALTHLGNGIPKTLPRHDNPLWAGIANDDLIAMMITDGHHLPDTIIKTIIRTKGLSNVIVVSDASPIAGLPPGLYHSFGNEVILEKSGLLYNPNTEYLVGSSSTMVDCMNYLSTLNLLSLDGLLKIGFYNPLNLLGIPLQSIVGAPMKYEEKKFIIDH